MLRRTLTSIAFVLALLCSYNGMSRARLTADESQEEALRELEAKGLSAEDDPNALESILADDFIHVLSVGFVTKRGQITFMRAHPQPSRETKHFEDLKIRVFGSAAVANGIVVATGTNWQTSQNPIHRRICLPRRKVAGRERAGIAADRVGVAYRA